MAGLLAVMAGFSGCGGAMPDPVLQRIDPRHIRVASLNIRYLDLTEQGATGPRGLADWEARRLLVLAALRDIDADFVAFQEMENWSGAPQSGNSLQREWLARQMSDYGEAAASGPQGRESSQPIFYRRSAYSLLDEGAVELGNALGRIGAFAGYSDLVTWARLQRRGSSETLTVINLHLHYTDALRRVSGAEIARDLARQAAARGDRVVVLGDLNVGLSSRPVEILRAARFPPIPSQGASFHFNAGFNALGAIDHIFHGERLAPVGPTHILRAGRRGIWPSDHYPIWADLRLV